MSPRLVGCHTPGAPSGLRLLAAIRQPAREDYLRERNRDKIFHQVRSVEEAIQLANAGDPLVKLPASCHPGRPAYIFISNVMLGLVLQNNIRAVEASCRKASQTDDERASAVAQLDGYYRLQSWLRTNPNRKIFIGMYPAPEHEAQIWEGEEEGI